MKKIVFFFLGQIIIAGLFLGILSFQTQKAQAETKNYPAGIVFSTGTEDDFYMSSTAAGPAQSFPGGKLASDACKDSEGYETFPTGKIYPVDQNEKERLEANLNFQKKYPTAFKCDGNPRYFWGGDLVLASSPTVSPTPTASNGTTPDLPVPNVSDINFPNTNFTDLVGLITSIINWLLGFGGILAVIAIVYSGIMYMTAGSDQTKAENAKKNLTWTIIGVVVILLALFIINLIDQILSGTV